MKLEAYFLLCPLKMYEIRSIHHCVFLSCSFNDTIIKKNVRNLTDYSKFAYHFIESRKNIIIDNSISNKTSTNNHLYITLGSSQIKVISCNN